MPVFKIHQTLGPISAVVLDSPHSGRDFPSDFGHQLTEQQLRSGEDVDIQVLYQDAAAQGAPFLEALFPRTYIDPNRAAGDIDLSLMDQAWPYFDAPYSYTPSGKASIGKAVIWRTVEDATPIYANKLSPESIKHRIDTYLLPYQNALKQLIIQAHSAHGHSVHINCHSMEPVGGAMAEGGAGNRRADIVLGDRDGSTCAPGLTQFVKAFFEREGYSVAVNDPYKGVELVRYFSAPLDGRHSLQLEINKALYLKHPTAALARDASREVGANISDPFERSSNFYRLQKQLTQLVLLLVNHSNQNPKAFA